MEKQKRELDPVAERLMAFVESNGGPSPVAAKLGKHPQLFYNIRDGKSKPSMDTLREVKRAFEASFNLDWVIMGSDEPTKLSPGEPPGEEYTDFQEVKALSKEEENDDVEVIRLKLEGKYKDKRIEDLEKMVDELKKDKAHIWQMVPRPNGDRAPMPRQTAEGNFNMVGSGPQTKRRSKKKETATFQDDADMLMLTQQLRGMVLATA